MELPIVDNEFMTLFLSENSEFTTDDVLEEFKIYIFRIMNLSVDALIQEQINNEYENNLLRRNFKSFFSEKISTVLEINELYNSCQEKLIDIQNLSHKNQIIIRDCSNLITRAEFNHQSLNISSQIETNKQILGNNSLIMDFITVPNIMINCIKNGCFTLYIEYLNYFNSLPQLNYEVYRVIKFAINKIHSQVKNFIFKNLQQNFCLDITLEEIHGILELPKNEFLTDVMKLEENSSSNKKLSALLYQFQVYFSNLDLQTKNLKRINSEKFLRFTREKFQILKTVLIEEELTEYFKLFIDFLMNDYLNTILKEFVNFKDVNQSIFSKENEFRCNTEIIINFFSQFFEDFSEYISENEQNTLFNEINQSLICFFFELFTSILNKAEINQTKYLNSNREMKKILSVDQTSSGHIKFDILIIIYNNLNEIRNCLIDNKLFLKQIKDKNRILTLVNTHTSSIIERLQSFFEQNMYLMKLELFRNEIIAFKAQLCEAILNPFHKDVYDILDLIKLWDQRDSLSKNTQWQDFLSDDII
jgi:hypothetical protein